MAERLALPTSDHGVAGSNPAGGEILPEPKRRFIAQSLLCSPFHHLEKTEILLKGRKTLTHPSILNIYFWQPSWNSLPILTSSFVSWWLHKLRGKKNILACVFIGTEWKKKAFEINQILQKIVESIFC